MPELPEVETTRRSLLQWALGHKITSVVVRSSKLRLALPTDLGILKGQTLSAVSRRAKYLILHIGPQNLLIHLGMSGSLRRENQSIAPKKHDHVDIVFENGDILRYHDPRRFGLMVWAPKDWNSHPLLSELGIEPLSDEFDGDRLYALTRKRSTAIKPFLMDPHYVVGVGNIYASEALFRAGIHPTRPAGQLSLKRCHGLAIAIQDTLRAALASGGSTLRDYVNGHGDPGSFQFDHHVYGHAGEPCGQCARLIRQIRQGNRATFYCPHCQR